MACEAMTELAISKSARNCDLQGAHKPLFPKEQEYKFLCWFLKQENHVKSVKRAVSPQLEYSRTPVLYRATNSEAETEEIN